MSSQSVNNADDVMGLFDDDANISPAASQMMINSLDDANIPNCMGEDLDDLEDDIITLVAIVMDASYSMKGNEQAVRLSIDELISALDDSKQATSMLVNIRQFDEIGNEKYIVQGFKKVCDVGKIGKQYTAEGNATALYESLKNALTALLAYRKQLMDGGIRVKSILTVFSDGGDNDSQVDAPDIRIISDDCLKDEQFYLNYVAYGYDPTAIANKVGFPNALEISNNPSEIRKSMGLVSKSIIRASQTQVGKSNTFFQ